MQCERPTGEQLTHIQRSYQAKDTPLPPMCAVISTGENPQLVCHHSLALSKLCFHNLQYSKLRQTAVGIVFVVLKAQILVLVYSVCINGVNH